MKIIKHGDVAFDCAAHPFVCPDCRCVFQAAPADLKKKYDERKNRSVIFVLCPECGYECKRKDQTGEPSYMTTDEMFELTKHKEYRPVVYQGARECIRIARNGDTLPDDEAAITAAINDGIPIIPDDRLPQNFPYKRSGLVDTAENWSIIEDIMSLHKAKDSNQS